MSAGPAGPSGRWRPAVAAPAHPVRTPQRGFKLAVAGGIGRAARWTGRDRATSLAGRVLARIEPRAIGALASRLECGNVVVSAASGKTATAAMVEAVATRAGTAVIRNRTGANLPGGIAAALMDAGGQDPGIRTGLGVFEVDERWLPPLAEQLDPQVMLLGNLSVGRCADEERERIGRRWAGAAGARAGRSRLVVCADDPLVASAGAAAPGALTYGIEDERLVHERDLQPGDLAACRTCGEPCGDVVTFAGRLGRWSCPACGSGRPVPDVAAEAVELSGQGTCFVLRTPAGRTAVRLPLPGVYNLYSALGAAALCHALGIDLPVVAAGLGAAEPALGGAERLDLDGLPVTVLLTEGPAGANDVVRTLAREDSPVDLLVVLDDRTAGDRTADPAQVDGVTWIWDVDWELLASGVRTVVCSGRHAADMALRLRHAGIDRPRLTMIDDVGKAVDQALARRGGSLFVLPTSPVLPEVREVLAQRARDRGC